MTAKWESQFIQSKVTDEIRIADGYEVAVAICIDTFVKTSGFQYDESGFTVMSDYNEL